MEGLVLIIILFVVFAAVGARSTASQPPRSSSRSSFSPPSARPSPPAATTYQYQPSPVVVDRAPQPKDQCSCGGRWIRRENSETGGRFWSCSNFPRCNNTRDEVMRDRHGPYWREIEQPELAICSNGHPRTPQNTDYNAAGHRICRDCKPVALPRASITRSPPSPKPAAPPKYQAGLRTSQVETCRNGHPRTPDNTYVRPDGERECRICRKNARRK
jgi:ssDNA-binding Zn-finger/Zn-ribbon topoisomerase 1